MSPSASFRAAGSVCRNDKRIRGGLIDLRDDLPVLVGDLREMESTGTVVQATLDAVQHGVHARQTAIVFDGAVPGANDVTVDVVDAWLARWSPPELGRKKPDRDVRDPLFPKISKGPERRRCPGPGQTAPARTELWPWRGAGTPTSRAAASGRPT